LKGQRNQSGAANSIAVSVQVDLIVLIRKKSARCVANAVTEIARDDRAAK
jgi:hypothetical protein